jgi:hypothetical protein
VTAQPDGSPPAPPDLLNDALYLGSLGFRVFPLAPRSKKGGPNRWQDKATSDPEGIRALWSEARPGANMAIRMGSEIRFTDGTQGILVGLDIDERTAFRGTDSIAQLEQELGCKLPDTATVMSGSRNGSHHLYLVVPHELIQYMDFMEDKTKSADDLAPGVLLKAHHSYLVGPGSLHDKTGLAYEWAAGFEPWTVGVAWMPLPWQAYLRRRSERRKQEDAERIRRRAENPNGQDPDRDFHGVNLPGWDQLLTDLGATPVGTKIVPPSREAYPTWLRPAGSDPPTSDYSAAVLDGGLWVYTDAWPTQTGGKLTPSTVTGTVYSRVGLFTAITQGGTSSEDFQAARGLARERYGAASLGEVRDLFGGGDGPGRAPGAGSAWLPAGATAQPVIETEDDEYPQSWRPVDLEPILAGEYQAPTPTLLYRVDGVGLFYRGAVNGIHGESGIGKSWIAVMATKAEITSGRSVLILDYEDTAVTMVDRLRRLGVSDDQIRRHLIYIRPTDPITAKVLDLVCEQIRTRQISLVGLDSVGEALAVEGLNEDKDNEVAPWNRHMPRRLSDAGAAVLLVDHGTKAGDKPLHPSGSKRKRAAFTGSSFFVNSPDNAPLGKAVGDEPHEGKLRMVCAKDRHGTHLQGKLSAEIRVVAHPDGHLEVDIFAPSTEPGRNDPDYITTVLCAQAAVNACRDEGKPLSMRSLLGLMQIKARDDLKKGGVELAVTRGALLETPGTNRARLFSYIRELPITPGDPT